MGVFNGSCPLPDNAGNIDAKGTAYNTLAWISIVSTGIAAVLLLSLKIAHLANYRNPREQRHIIRISLAPLMWATISMSGILHYKAAEYLDPVGEFIETIYLCSVFLLFVQYVVPGGDFGDEMFQLITDADEGGKKPVAVGWPRITWLMVFQCPIFGLVVFLLTEITQAFNDFCPNSLSPKYGNLWATIISSLSLGAAITCVIRFYGRTKSRINARRGFLKLVVLKSIVGLQWLQSLVFNILLEHDVIKPGKTFSYSDLLYGLPNTILCVEMVFFALGFWYACNPSEYSAKATSHAPRMPIYKAVFDAMNPWEIIRGIGRVFRLAPEFGDYYQRAKQLKQQTKNGGGNIQGMYAQTENDSRYYGGSNNSSSHHGGGYENGYDNGSYEQLELQQQQKYQYQYQQQTQTQQQGREGAGRVQHGEAEARLTPSPPLREEEMYPAPAYRPYDS